MDIRPFILWTVLGAAVVTLIPRVLPMLIFRRAHLPTWLVDWLRYVPPAVMSALLAQQLLLPDGRVTLPPTNLHLLAAVPTLLVAARTRSLLATVATGMAAMALLRAVLA